MARTGAAEMTFRRVSAGSKALRTLLRDRGWTLLRASEAIGVEPSTVYRWVSGELTPTLASAVMLEHRLGIDHQLWLQAVMVVTKTKP
jgi:plasmid maintenance system antidote protein VapI